MIPSALLISSATPSTAFRDFMSSHTSFENPKEASTNSTEVADSNSKEPPIRKITAFLLKWGIETHGYVYGHG